MDARTHCFIEALERLERDRDAEPLAALHAEAAKVGNTVSSETFSGPDGARRFWEEYRATFETIESEFRAVIDSDDATALEWRSTGTGAEGADFAYEGVSVIEWEGNRIKRFAAYFDPLKLGSRPVRTPGAAA
jgi:hypothetical protein